MAFNEPKFEKQLGGVVATEENIQTLSLLCFSKKEHHSKIVDCWSRLFENGDRAKRIALLYLANDVVQNSRSKRFDGFRDSFLPKFKAAFVLIREDVLIHAKMDRVLAIWEQRLIYDPAIVEQLRFLLTGSYGATPSAVSMRELTRSPSASNHRSSKAKQHKRRGSGRHSSHHSPSTPTDPKQQPASPTITMDDDSNTISAKSVNNSHPPPSPDTRERLQEQILANFKVETLSIELAKFRNVETAMENAQKMLPSIKFDDATFATIKNQLKDRNQGALMVNQMKEANTKLADFVTDFQRHVEQRRVLVDLLNQSVLFYSVQLSEAQVVENAYKTFGERIEQVKRQLDDMKHNLPSSPPRDAPSPTPFDDPFSEGVEAVAIAAKREASDHHEAVDMDMDVEDDGLNINVNQSYLAPQEHVTVNNSPLVRNVQRQQRYDGRDVRKANDVTSTPTLDEQQHPSSTSDSFVDKPEFVQLLRQSFGSPDADHATPVKFPSLEQDCPETTSAIDFLSRLMNTSMANNDASTNGGAGYDFNAQYQQSTMYQQGRHHPQSQQQQYNMNVPPPGPGGPQPQRYPPPQSLMSMPEMMPPPSGPFSAPPPRMYGSQSVGMMQPPPNHQQQVSPQGGPPPGWSYSTPPPVSPYMIQQQQPPPSYNPPSQSQTTPPPGVGGNFSGFVAPPPNFHQQPPQQNTPFNQYSQATDNSVNSVSSLFGSPSSSIEPSLANASFDLDTFKTNEYLQTITSNPDEIDDTLYRAVAAATSTRSNLAAVKPEPPAPASPPPEISEVQSMEERLHRMIQAEEKDPFIQRLGQYEDPRRGAMLYNDPNCIPGLQDPFVSSQNMDIDQRIGVQNTPDVELIGATRGKKRRRHMYCLDTMNNDEVMELQASNCQVRYDRSYNMTRNVEHDRNLPFGIAPNQQSPFARGSRGRGRRGRRGHN